MAFKLENYLRNQKSRLFFYHWLEAIFVGLFLFALMVILGSYLDYFSRFLSFASIPSGWVLRGFMGLGLLLVAFLLIRQVIRQTKAHQFTLSSAAKEIEQQSPYFLQNINRRSELVSASKMLEDRSFSERGSFSNAHFHFWQNRLFDFKVELSPSSSLYFKFILAVISFFVLFEFPHHLQHRLPNRIKAWVLPSFEEKRSLEDSDWELREGSLSAVSQSQIRFASPDYGWLQTFLFVQEGVKPWTFVPCHQFCEWTVAESGQYAVGTLAFRSAIYPLVMLPDEEPKAVIFVKEADDLIPSATVLVENKEFLDLHLLASDDLLIHDIALLHRFEDKEDPLWQLDHREKNFKKEERLSLAEWSGGRHEIFVRVSDGLHSVDSSPVVILYADENFKREKRVQDLRALIGEWVHVLADLLEFSEDDKIDPSLSTRLSQISYPENAEGLVVQLYAKDLKALGDRIQVDLVIGQKKYLIDSYISEVERKILYGLSLIFQEQVGDIQASQDALSESQRDLNSLLDDLRSGKEEIDSEKIKEAFDRLTKQLKDLMEKASKLPRGPNDDLINREALDEQVSQAESLEDQIEEIKRKLAEGKDAEALKELESLVNQLSILQKEMERSFSQFQENLEDNAFESSKEFEKKLSDILKKQEDLAKATESLKEQQEKEQLERLQNWQRPENESSEELQKQFEEMSKKQAEIGEEFNEAQSEFENLLKGTQWEGLMGSEEIGQTNEEIKDRMRRSKEALDSVESLESLIQQKEAIELLKKAQEGQQQARQQLEQQMQEQSMTSGSREISEKMEFLDRRGKGEMERRRKIMNSRNQKVDDQFQPSHERYFEELLQR